jgi:hypothetical protein
VRPGLEKDVNRLAPVAGSANRLRAWSRDGVAGQGASQSLETFAEFPCADRVVIEGQDGLEQLSKGIGAAAGRASERCRQGPGGRRGTAASRRTAEGEPP